MKRIQFTVYYFIPSDDKSPRIRTFTRLCTEGEAQIAVEELPKAALTKEAERWFHEDRKFRKLSDVRISHINIVVMVELN